MRLALIAMCALFFAGCAHSIHQVHTSDFVPMAELESGKVVRGYAEQFVVLGLVQETNYVDQAYADIQRQCPRGQITGITTQISTSMGFFSWTNKALMQGLCTGGN